MKKHRFEGAKFDPGCGRADPSDPSAMPTSPPDQDAGTFSCPIFTTCRLATVLLLAGTFLVACAQLSRPVADVSTHTNPQAAPDRKAPVSRTITPLPPTPEQRLGVVRIIGARASFVLIETPSAAVTAAAPAGYVLHCRPPGVATGASTADLRISAERRPPFVIADVLAGTPTVGDVAYLARDNDPAPVPIRSGVPFSSVIPAAEPVGTPAPTL